MTAKKAIAMYKSENKKQAREPETIQDTPIVLHRVEVPLSLKTNPGLQATNTSLISD